MGAGGGAGGSEDDIRERRTTRDGRTREGMREGGEAEERRGGDGIWNVRISEQEIREWRISRMGLGKSNRGM